MDDLDNLDRRGFLVSGGTISAGLLTGCLGADSPNQSDNTSTNTSGGDATTTDSSGGTADFPTRDIKLVIPYGPGGGFDYYVRATGKYLGEYLPNKVNIVPQNVEGAGGRVATEQVYNADPDGYTNMLLNVAAVVRDQVTADVNYDVTDMTYYAQILNGSRAIGVANNAGIDNWDQLVTAINDNEVNFAVTGRTTAGTIVFSVIAELADLFPLENVLDGLVTYDGFGEAASGLQAGDAQVMAGGYPSLLEFANSDILHIPMVVSMDEQPPDQTPDAETLATSNLSNGQGIANLCSDIRVFVGPPDIPTDRVDILRDAFDGAINDENLRSEAQEADRPINYADAEQARDATVNALELWRENQELLDRLGF